MSQTCTGQIITSYGRRYIVETPEGVRYDCTTRGKKTDYACGDHVDLLVQNAEQAVIERAQPRQSLLYRSDAFRSKLIAANVTQLAIVLAPVPTFSEELLNRCLVAAEAGGIAPLIVLNKCDLPAAWPAAAAAAGGIAARVSATTGAGIGELLNLIAAQVQADALEPELPGAITDRQQEAVARAAAALAALQAALAATAGVECLLVEAKAVAAALDELTGRTTSDDILHAVFSRFCVGK